MDTTKRWRLYKDVLEDQVIRWLLVINLLGIIFACSEQSSAVILPWIASNVIILVMWAWLGRNAADFIMRSYAIDPAIAQLVVKRFIETHGWQYWTDVQDGTRLFHIEEYGVAIGVFPIVARRGPILADIYISPNTAANAPFIQMLQIKLDQDLTPHGLI